MALNACLIAENINARAIVVITKEGFTARTVLKHRPKVPVIVITNSNKTARQLNFFWGIEKIVVTKEVMRSEDAKKFFEKGEEIVVIKLSNEKRSLVQLKA